jgi:hypothetical protein
MEFADIQPLRIYEDKAELQRSAYYEKNKHNVSNVFTLVPEDLFIPFIINIPSNFTFIVYAKLYCPDNTTVKFDFKTNLKNATDLKIVSFTDENGITRNRVQYLPSEGFLVGGSASNIPLGLGYLKVHVKNPITGAEAFYRSDLFKVFDKDEAPTGGVLISDPTLIATYFS